jgi:hypothetical protein
MNNYFHVLLFKAIFLATFHHFKSLSVSSHINSSYHCYHALVFRYTLMPPNVSVGHIQTILCDDEQAFQLMLP